MFSCNRTAQNIQNAQKIYKVIIYNKLPVVVSPNNSSLCGKSASSCPAALATAAAPAPSRELSLGGDACSVHLITVSDDGKS